MASLPELCEQQVHQTVAQGDPEQHGIIRDALAGRIVDIVSRNRDSGRAERIMAESGGAEEQRSPSTELRTGSGAEEQGSKGAEEQGSRGESITPPPPLHPSAQLEAYVDRVIATYLREHDRVEALAAKDGVAWTELSGQLTDRAYHMLLRWQVPAAKAANEAEGCAQQACEAIFGEPFPYDVPFDAWSGRILVNLILQRYTRSKDLMDQNPGVLSLDQPGRGDARDDVSLHEFLVDESAESAFESIAVREWLIQAIAGLPSEAQRQVIIDTFFYELSDDEIARRLGKSKQAVYNLRHRALGHLRRISGA